MHKRINILGVQTTSQTFADAIATLAEWASSGKRYVSTCPVYTIMACNEDAAALSAVNGADMVTADGMPVVWVQRKWGFPDAQRVYGPDIVLALCEATAGKGIRHFFWGGLPGVPEKLAETLTTRFPGLEVVGGYSPPFAPMEDKPLPDTIQRINEVNPHIVWVGLGSPKHDLWMQRYRPHFNAPLLIGVGAAFDFIAGTKRQAPHWMQRNGLEWLFRLVQEPRRLWRRYLIYNPLFIIGVIRQLQKQDKK
jgi:N-acetylglucosaminyldiphosphoundecaprenol N-acetyl-beta-D-mannosaminyltransferase